jgi:hypothetical protein
MYPARGDEERATLARSGSAGTRKRTMSQLQTEQTRVQKLIAGTNKHFATASSLAFGSETTTPQALTQLFQSFVDAFTGVMAAKATYTAKLQAERTLAASVRLVIQAYEAFVRATFSKSPDVLADFGLAPHKVTKPTVATKVVAVDRRLATRKARHTMGKKAKLAITGTLPEAPAAASPVVKVAAVSAEVSALPPGHDPAK